MAQDKNQQEVIFKLNLFEQQIKQLQAQLEAVDKTIADNIKLNEEIGGLKNSSGKEIMASIERGIFIKSKITSEDLIVDIGGKNFVKKNVGETQEIIKGQIEKLDAVKKELEENLSEVNEEMTKVFMDFQKSAQ